MNRHTKAKPFVCGQCKFGFRSRIKLAKHKKKTCKATDKFVCKTCQKHFKSNNKLKEHVLTHSLAKNFKCAQCEDAFYTTKELTSHVVSVHVPDELQHSRVSDTTQEDEYNDDSTKHTVDHESDVDDKSDCPDDKTRTELNAQIEYEWEHAEPATTVTTNPETGSDRVTNDTSNDGKEVGEDTDGDHHEQAALDANAPERSCTVNDQENGLHAENDYVDATSMGTSKADASDKSNEKAVSQVNGELSDDLTTSKEFLCDVDFGTPEDDHSEYANSKVNNSSTGLEKDRFISREDENMNMGW